ncbi:MAG: hypothetical protein JJT99_12055 [Rhodobacteraceae bacterium]|nr:hypothetical protein [Paracoccaceae bacterium]
MKPAPPSKDLESKIETLESRAEALNDRAATIRENAQERADAVRDAYQCKADGLRDKGMDRLANLVERMGESKAAKIEHKAECKAAKLEAKADHLQGKADRLKEKLDDSDDNDDNGDDGDNGDNGDDGDEDAATYDKVYFVLDPDANDGGGSGTIYEWDQLSPEVLEEAGLEPDAEPTFANYVAVFEATSWFDIEDLQEVRFFAEDEFGDLREIEEMRIEAPEGGFADADALLAAYDEAIAAMGHEMNTESLFISMDLDEMMPAEDDEAEEDDTTFA